MHSAIPSNAELAELLWRAAREETDHRRRALERAGRAARFWTEEASTVVDGGRSLTDLHAVGPWVAHRMQDWLDHPPPVPEPDPERRGFLSLAHVRRVLDADPAWEAMPHGDLQVHSTDSDGKLSLGDMATAAKALGRTFIASTDHSQSLRIANGMDAAELAAHNALIDRINHEAIAADEPFRVLRSIEMDVFVDGSGDMDPTHLHDLDLVLGAFHSKLRVAEDVTDRYLAALRNPAVHVLAHPTTRMYGRRVGLVADWARVFD